MDWLKDVNLNEIIVAASTPLGIMAIAIIALSIIAYLFFARDSDIRIRLFVFILLFTGFGSFAFAVNDVLIVKGNVQRQLEANANTNVVPPVVQADPCQGIDASYDPNGATGHAFWCGTKGATRTSRQQAAIDRTQSCIYHATQSYGNMTQNELWLEAVSLAKQGKDDEAMARLDACQCHNPVSQMLQREARQKILCFLKKQ
jgi:hypothetical protein